MDLTRNHLLAAVAASCVVSTAALADQSVWGEVAPVSRSTSANLEEAEDLQAEIVYLSEEDPLSGEEQLVFAGDRETTQREHAIAELRRWKDLPEDWDGEGAKAPIQRSLDDARAFACSLDEQSAPEPMLHASGRAGLYWKEEGFYADLEFRGDGRVAYYIERGDDRHKGVAHFHGKSLPQVFAALLESVPAA